MTRARQVCAPRSHDAAHTPLRALTAAAAALGALTLSGCDLVQLVDETDETGADLAEVIAVVDGDTIDVRTDDGEERVRLIGIDSPEIGRDGAADECYAQEARTWLDELVYGQPVQLVSDPTQDDRDRYGRLLRYVLLDGRSVAADAIAEGLAYEYTYDVPYERQAEHIAAQEAAEADGLGLWGAC